MKRILRVFPRRTNMTPTDRLAYVNCQPSYFDILEPEFEEVHISITFTEDIPKAEKLYIQWEAVGVPIDIGGPAFGIASGEFTPGLYLKEGITITSRGCPNDCWFCSVPQREDNIRELEIKDGYNVLDDNLFACSDDHIRKVFEMLARQKEKPKFTGGLEAARLKPWHAAELKKLKPERLYFAYDMPGKLDALYEAGNTLRAAGFTTASNDLSCYVLIGYPDDTYEDAEKRLNDTIKAGFMPFAMLYVADGITHDQIWQKMKREWCNRIIVGSKMKGAVNI